MTQRPFAWFFLRTLGLSAITGCVDLRLADRLDTATTPSQGGVVTATTEGGSTALGGQGGSTPLDGQGGSTPLGGRGGSTPLDGQGGTTPLGGRGGSTPLDGQGGSTPLDGQGGTTPLDGQGGSTPLDGQGGSTPLDGQGGSTPLGGQGGSTRGDDQSTIAGANTGGVEASGGGTTSGVNVCPIPISKPEALLAAEPTPDDSCARVSNVAQIGPASYVYGFTNGEIHLFDPSSTSSSVRVDTWRTSVGSHALPRAVVTSMVAPRHNNEGALQVGYADPQGTAPNPWLTGAMRHGWSEATVEQPGTAMTITVCPFHGGHLELATPWITQGSLTSGASYATADAHQLNKHLQLPIGNDDITAIETVTKTDGWLVYVGTRSGQLYISNLLPETVIWNDTTSSLNTVVTWTRLTGALMPERWITRLAVHPAHPERIFAVFYSNDGDAVWYSSDAGQTWSNRQANLPTMSNTLNKAPPVLGVSFNPFLDGAAYAVTSLTSYYSVDDGRSWSEW
jgi:hypothetical protein